MNRILFFLLAPFCLFATMQDAMLGYIENQKKVVISNPFKHLGADEILFSVQRGAILESVAYSTKESTTTILQVPSAAPEWTLSATNRLFEQRPELIEFDSYLDVVKTKEFLYAFLGKGMAHIVAFDSSLLRVWEVHCDEKGPYVNFFYSKEL